MRNEKREPLQSSVFVLCFCKRCAGDPAGRQQPFGRSDHRMSDGTCAENGNVRREQSFAGKNKKNRYKDKSDMKIRRAEKRDIDRVLHLLSQVLETHAKLRPDLFISGTTKYTGEELEQMFADEKSPVYVAVDEKDEAVGHAFVRIRNIEENNMYPAKILFFDDLCIDSAHRGKHVGEALFRFVMEEAKRLGCREILFYEWEGNDIAKNLYRKMGAVARKTQMEVILPES